MYLTSYCHEGGTCWRAGVDLTTGCELTFPEAGLAVDNQLCMIYVWAKVTLSRCAAVALGV